MSNSFKNDLIKYNKLFDEYQHINFQYAKKYNEEAQQILKRSKERGQKTSFSSYFIYDTLADLNKLVDITTFNSFKNFCKLPNIPTVKNGTEQTDSKVTIELNPSELLFSGSTFGKIEISGGKAYCLKQLDRGKNVLLTLKDKHPSKEVDEALNAYEAYRDKISNYKRTFSLFRGTGFGVYGVGGFISAIALFALIFYRELATAVTCIVLLTIFGGAMIARLIHNHFFLPKKEKENIDNEKIFFGKIDHFINLVINDLIKVRDREYIDFVSSMNKYDIELKSIGDKWEAKLANDTKTIKDKMSSFEVIDKSINILIENYGNEIHYSKDYMDLFEKNMFIDIQTQEAFLNAVRVLVEKKKTEIKEKKLQEQRNIENAEKQERELIEQAYQKHIQEETIKEQKKQTQIMLQQQESSKLAAISLCWSCKYRIGCALKNKLSSPVCSKYQNRY